MCLLIFFTIFLIITNFCFDFQKIFARKLVIMLYSTIRSVFISNNTVSYVRIIGSTFLRILFQRHIIFTERLFLVSNSQRRISFAVIFKDICYMLLICIETKLVFCYTFFLFRHNGFNQPNACSLRRTYKFQTL